MYIATSFAQQSARPWLGVAIEQGEKGVLVKSTMPDTPAEQGGILAGDEILKVDSRVVKTPEELVKQVTSKGIGYEVQIEVLRKSKKLIKKMKLVARPDMLEVANKALLNKKSPEFEANIIKGMDGTKFTNKDFIGKVTILEFWATWCVACVSSYPRLIEFANENKEKINVVSISGEEKPVLKKFLDKAPAHIPGLKDAPIVYLQSPESEVGGKYFASAIPIFILIDQKGIVRKLVIGGGSIMEEIFAEAGKLVK